MTAKAPESPVPVYRGLDRCDLCGAPLTPPEQRAGLCHACRWPARPRRPAKTRTATRRPRTDAGSRGSEGA